MGESACVDLWRTYDVELSLERAGGWTGAGDLHVGHLGPRGGFGVVHLREVGAVSVL